MGSCKQVEDILARVAAGPDDAGARSRSGSGSDGIQVEVECITPRNVSKDAFPGLNNFFSGFTNAVTNFTVLNADAAAAFSTARDGNFVSPQR